MRVLVLGGTVFLGRHLVGALRGRGHEVTLFNRGRSAPALFPDVVQLRGDRDGGLEALREAIARAAPEPPWDAVIDTCGYVPRVVAAGCALLREACARYLFVSTISVYAEPLPPDADERAPLAVLGDPASEDVPAHYGALKAACEAAVVAAFATRATIVRPGLIVGPDDPTGRFTYWPLRLACGGDVLAPGPAVAPVQFIDVRDLAQFVVELLEDEADGTYDATGPAEPLSLGELLAACARVADSEARLHWRGAETLVEAGVVPWTGLPLWLGGADDGFMRLACRRAHASGLRLRPLEETIADTLAWARMAGDAARGRPGMVLSPEREQHLLATLPA